MAIYIYSFKTCTLRLDREGDGNHLEDVPDGTFTFTRGDISKYQGLRLKIKIPDGQTNSNGKQLTVSNIYDLRTKKNIMYAAQFADYIKMTVGGVTISGSKVADAQECVGAQADSSTSGVALPAAIQFLRGPKTGLLKPKGKPYFNRRG